MVIGFTDGHYGYNTKNFFLILFAGKRHSCLYRRCVKETMYQPGGEYKGFRSDKTGVPFCTPVLLRPMAFYSFCLGLAMGRFPVPLAPTDAL